LDRIIADDVGDLAQIGDAKRRGRRQRDVESSFYQQAVFCERYARNAEADARGGEGECRVRHHVVESVLPRDRDFRIREKARPAWTSS
jgi:hypothetical protein